MASQQDHYFQGMELFGDDDLDGGISEFQKALAIDESYGDALHAIALCHYHLGQLNEAVEYGERLRSVEPDNPLAYTALSMFYNAKGMIAKAEEMGAKAGAAPPSEDSS